MRPTRIRELKMKKMKLFKVALVAILIAGSMTIHAQTVKVSGTVGTNSKVDINGQTAITNLANADGLIVARKTPNYLSNGCDLFWGAFYEYQPYNPGLFSLTSVSALGWDYCFTVKANGNTGIFNPNPSVALEIGSSSSIRQVKVNGNIVFGSDMRMKENIKEISSSLNRLKQLQSVSYNLKEEKKEEKIPEKFLKDGTDIDALKAEIEKAPKTNEDLLSRNLYGFLAQDVQKVLPDLVYADDAGMLSIDYIGLIPLLVDGLQEQQQLIEKLQQKETESTKEQFQMQKEIEALKEALDRCCKTSQEGQIMDEAKAAKQSSNINSENIILYQNAPNPFNEITNIQCYIPITIKKAELCIYDMKGTQLKCIVISGRETTNVQIQAGELSAGMYVYAIIGDGKTSDAKTMIVTK